MKNLPLPALAMSCLFLALPRTVTADKTFAGEGYAITFGMGWDTLMSAGVLGKTRGFDGLATLGAAEGSELPDMDSLEAAYADSLGGTLIRDSSATLVLGGYETHWRKFTYDSLPRLSAAISRQAGIPLNLANGAFRVYYLAADGMVFEMAVFAVLPGSLPPYDDIEKAIATLKLGEAAGIRNGARSATRDLRIRRGRLEGAWLAAEKVRAVDAFDARGALVGPALPAGGGAWILPGSPGRMLLRIRTASGREMSLGIGP